MIHTGTILALVISRAYSASLEVPISHPGDIRIVENQDKDILTNTIDDTLGTDDIIEVVNNFIAEEDPMLQLFLNLCFLHPSCYQLELPSTNTSSSPISRTSLDMKKNLLARKTETARNILLKMVKQVQEKIKVLMFKYIEKGVGERGVSLVATRNIIDTFKSLWESQNNDLEYVTSSLQEIFYLVPLDTKEQVEAMVEIAEVVQRIPNKTEKLMEERYTQIGLEEDESQ